MVRLPEELQEAIDRVVEKSSGKALAKAREEMSLGYKEGKRSLFEDEATRLVYLAARMPATFAAVLEALKRVPFGVESVLDVGAGPGTATWAAREVFGDAKYTLFERSSDAIALGKELMPFAAEWKQAMLPCELPKVDLAILSYVVNEVQDMRLVKDAWESAETVVIVEPGTMKGAANIRAAREQLLKLGANIAAPCPHQFKCPSDWCHFAARVERTKLHRQVKGGQLGYEDEKFSYLIATKKDVKPGSDRVVRHPQKLTGHVRFTVCSVAGLIEEKVVTRKDKTAYRAARDAEWGDTI